MVLIEPGQSRISFKGELKWNESEIDVLGDIVSIQFLDIDRIDIFTNQTGQSWVIG